MSRSGSKQVFAVIHPDYPWVVLTSHDPTDEERSQIYGPALRRAFAQAWQRKQDGWKIVVIPYGSSVHTRLTPDVNQVLAQLYALADVLPATMMDAVRARAWLGTQAQGYAERVACGFYLDRCVENITRDLRFRALRTCSAPAPRR